MMSHLHQLQRITLHAFSMLAVRACVPDKGLSIYSSRLGPRHKTGAQNYTRENQSTQRTSDCTCNGAHHPSVSHFHGLISRELRVD